MIKKLGFLVAIILIVLILTVLFSDATFIMTPYLQAVTADSVYVLVESNSIKPVTVKYGKNSNYGNEAITEKIELTTAFPMTYIHNIKLTGLLSNKQYHYRVFQGRNYSAEYTFWTAANPGTNFRFAWMADCRTGVKIHDQIAKRIKKAQPRFSIYGGDLCYRESYQSFKEEFFRPNELALIAEVPFFNSPGNHEEWSQNTKAFTQSPPSPSADQGYYSFDYGDLHVLVLNTEEENRNTRDAQYRFAKADLEGSKKTWKIVISHKPAYCAGGHGEDETMKMFTKNIFEPNRVKMVISGHSHFYQHNLVNGIHHLVIGSAGAPLHSPETAPYTVKSIEDYNYAIAEVTPAIMKMVVYNEHGQVLEEINLKK